MLTLPAKAPKIFENFDFSLLKGKAAEHLKVLASLSMIYSHRNLAFIGPAGTGKTHLEQAFGLYLLPKLKNTRLFFDLIGRRYGKESSFKMIFTSNKNSVL